MTTPDGLVHALRLWPGFLDRVGHSASRMSDLSEAEDDAGAAAEDESQARPGAEPDLPLPAED